MRTSIPSSPRTLGGSLRSPRIAPALAALAFVACTLAPSPHGARAAEPSADTLPINVITIQSTDADDQAEALTKALRTAVRNMPGWSLAPGDYSLEVLALSLKCPDPPDANCQSRIADQVKTDRYVWGTLKKKGANVVGAVHFWVRGKGTTDLPLDYAANLVEANDDALKHLAEDAINQITGGPPRGSVHVRTPGVNGQLFVDGVALGALQGEGTFLVPSGPHKLTVRANGFVDLDTQVFVKPGAPLDVNLSLVATGDANGTNKRRIAGGALVGAGVLFAIIGIASSAQVASAQSAINVEKNSVSAVGFDWCNPGSQGGTLGMEAATLTSACSKGKTFEAMQAVFYPLAAIAGGAGIYLLVTAGKPAAAPAAGLSVTPEFGPKNGKLAVSYTF